MTTLSKALTEQLDLPVSFDTNGSPVTLRDLVVGGPSLSQSALTFDQRVKIAAERIKRQPYAEIATIGAGVINRERAIAEIEAKSPIGRVLIEAENHLIDKLMKEVKSGRLKEMIHE